MKLCKDCKWNELDTESHDEYKQVQYARCDNPKNLIYYVDPVSGADMVRRDITLCRDQRSVNWLGAIVMRVCGTRGRWYE